MSEDELFESSWFEFLRELVRDAPLPPDVAAHCASPHRSSVTDVDIVVFWRRFKL
jgi:hypothetical protein